MDWAALMLAAKRAALGPRTTWSQSATLGWQVDGEDFAFGLVQ